MALLLLTMMLFWGSGTMNFVVYAQQEQSSSSSSSSMCQLVVQFDDYENENSSPVKDYYYGTHCKPLHLQHFELGIRIAKVRAETEDPLQLLLSGNSMVQSYTPMFYNSKMCGGNTTTNINDVIRKKTMEEAKAISYRLALDRRTDNDNSAANNHRLRRQQRKRKRNLIQLVEKKDHPQEEQRRQLNINNCYDSNSPCYYYCSKDDDDDDDQFGDISDCDCSSSSCNNRHARHNTIRRRRNLLSQYDLNNDDQCGQNYMERFCNEFITLPIQLRIPHVLGQNYTIYTTQRLQNTIEVPVKYHIQIVEQTGITTNDEYKQYKCSTIRFGGFL